MKEEIYTIPILDGFHEHSECPFCSMRRALEEKTLDYVMSPAYMEEDVRGLTNELGFCSSHLTRLYTKGNALGLGLMLTSHLSTVRGKLSSLMQGQDPSSKGKGLFKKTSPESPLSEYLRYYKKSCYVCSRMDEVMGHYFDAFFLVLKKEKELHTLLQESKGFCVEDFLSLYITAGNHLSGEPLVSFRNLLWSIQEKKLTELQEDIEWFTQKFDYRYANEPWKNSKDALPRTLEKLRGAQAEK